LLKDLCPARQHSTLSEYVDVATDVEGQSARIYLFSRVMTKGENNAANC
jgi:hypothetical protein